MADGFTPAEQYLLQLTNRERIRVGSQPVANYSVLDNSADGHTDRGFATDTFQHETDLVGFISSYGFEWRAGSYGMWENHQWSSGYPGDLQAQVNVHFNGYMNSASHRANILDPNHELAGMSFEVGEFAGYDPAYYSTQHFAENERATFLLGAAYSDSILSDRFYSIGEGLGALIVDVRDTVTGAHTILNTDVTGGFQLELGSGKFQVELINPATGLHTAPQSITLTDLNRQLNFESPSFLTP